MPRSVGESISINDGRASAAATDLLVEAGAVLASSLDPTTTMGQVARLTVPRFADLCVIDLRDHDGAIRDVAVAAAQDEIAQGLEGLRARYPLDPAGGHPVARVLRSGTAELLPEMTSMLLKSFAQGDEHARFMIDHGYRSAVVAPLLARDRTLGALSVLRFRDGELYTEADLDLVCELARRAALAIDNARLFSELRRVERRLEAILTNLAEAVTVVDEHGRTVFANQAAVELLGVDSPQELTSAEPGATMSRFLVLDEQGRELELECMPGRRLFRGERPDPLLVRNIVRATGEERWLIVRSSPVLDGESERVRFAVNVFENITEVKRAQLAESFMAEVSRVLASSMDYAETLQRVARLAVPQIADWCAVDLLNERGEIERVAVHHSDPRRLALAERLDRAYHPMLHEPSGLPEVIRTGRPLIATEIPEDALAAYARNAEHLEMLLEVGATAVIIVPIAGATGPIGAITLVSSESTRRLSEADLALAERLGRRAGTAVENARLYTERARIAHTLQRALLPESLPAVAGVELQALYSAAGELNEVGGDFYDVFEYGAGRWMLVIGDVCGKGPHAAGVTALARHTLRAAASNDQSPAEMLDTLHRALRRQPPGIELCTVCLVTLTPAPGRARLTITLAGHPPPLLVGVDGEVAQVGRHGTLLGVIDPIDIAESEAELRAGETLLLYTDGVPEAGRSSGALGEGGLMGLCRDAAGLSLQELLERIERVALERSEGRLRDDIALIAVRVDPAR
jgi:PAS domain S-box-containing protein